jgi:transposase InsO family protein
MKRKLERIHSDICSQFPESKGNSIYILTFLDDFTHWCWVVAIPNKSSATIQKAFRDLIKQIETESELKIKYLRTDGGGEYQGELTPLLKELGIKHEPTSPHSPQSNGKAERLNRTLNEHVRAMLYQANMLKSFWAEAMATAAHLINRLPSDTVNAIPYELWHNKILTPRDLQSLKPFGCLVHAHVPEARHKPLNKVDPRLTCGCFIGYTDTTTIHKIWDFERKCFVNSHDLIFEETHFPKPSDFDEPPADPYEYTPPSPSSEPEPRQIFDEIIIQPPPALQVYASYDNFQPENDPPSFADAMRHPDAGLWWDAFCAEMKAIIANNTWILTELPRSFKALPLKWVCRTKRDANNVFEKYKARIVVKGYA